MNKDIPETATWAIETRGLEKSFGERLALRGIDLTVHQGERLVIFGPNGAGKTTLLKILSTLVKPSAGSVRLGGIDVRDKRTDIRSKISLVSHQTFLYDNLTVFENLTFYGKMYDVADLKRRIHEVITWVQLESRLDDRVGTLSRGLQQRASIARAVLHNPSILFLDEPEVGLDSHASSMLGDILGGINSDGKTVVMTTHDLKRGLEMSDSIVILDRGQIVFKSSKHELSETNFQQIYDRCTETGR